MPLVAGETLEQRLSRERVLPHEETMRILREAASGLAAAHDAGLIHRDIKPSNLMLEQPNGRLLVTDFGVAKAIEEGGGSGTASSILAGTPKYMSPEQATGDPVDQRSDLYSLGVVAYEMVTGRPPFEGSSSRHVILKHITEAPEPVRSLRPDCPENLARVIERCLAKEPEERFQGASEALEALAWGREVAGPGRVGVIGVGHTAGPVRRFRRTVLLGIAAAVAAPVLEVTVTGGVTMSFLVWLTVLFILAVRYGRLWSAGHSLREALGLGRPSLDATVLHDGATRGGFEAFGAQKGIVRECRAERARIVLLFGDLSRAEQRRLDTLVTVVDQLLGGIRRLARQLAALDGRVEFEEQAAARVIGSTEVGFLGHDTTVTELEGAREEKALKLRSFVEQLGEVRRLLERSTAGEPVDALARLIASLRKTECLDRRRGLIRPSDSLAGPHGDRRAAAGQDGEHRQEDRQSVCRGARPLNPLSGLCPSHGPLGHRLSEHR